MTHRAFTTEEFQARSARVQQAMAERGNVYYLTG